MSGFATGSAPPRSVGVLEYLAAASINRPLKPQALLRRLRPLRLERIARYLHEYDRYNIGHRLVESLFPGRMENWAGTTWWAVLHYLACLLEEFEWFAVNWDALNDAYMLWMETYGEQDADEHLAVFLHYIPVRLFGFSADDFGCVSENRVYELFWVLLKPNVGQTSSEVLIEAELYDLLDYNAELRLYPPRPIPLEY